MSSRDKRVFASHVVGTAAATETVRLFAFTNRRQGYEVVFSPSAPIIILKSKASATPQHPCLQWAPFTQLVYDAQPNSTPAVYVVDTSCLQSPEYQLPEAPSTTPGPILKKLRNVLSKLNPSDGILVAAGVSAFLALKYVLSGEKNLGVGNDHRLIRCLLLVCPGPAPTEAMKKLAALVHQYAPSSSTQLEIRVVVKTAVEATAWGDWLASLPTSLCVAYAIHLHHESTSPSLFNTIRRACGIEDEAGADIELDESRFLPTPRVFRIDLYLSKQSKTVVQEPKLSPLHTLGYEEEDEEEDEEEGEEEEEGSCSSCCEDDEGDEEDQTGGWTAARSVLDLPYFKSPMRVVLEGRLSARGTLPLPPAGCHHLYTTEGVVVVKGLPAVADQALLPSSSSNGKQQSGAAVRVTCTMERDDAGCTLFTATALEVIPKSVAALSATVPSVSQSATPYSISATRHYAAALVIRGRKCALVKDDDTQFLLPVMPTTLEESWAETALRAACTAFDCTSDNFYAPHYLSPTTFYRTHPAASSGPAVVDVVHLYVLVVCSGPPGGAASDAVEDEICNDYTYEWLSFAAATEGMRWPHERKALEELKDHLNEAHRVGLYHPARGCGVFGDAVQQPSRAAAKARDGSSGTKTASKKKISTPILVAVGCDPVSLLPALTAAANTQNPILLGVEEEEELPSGEELAQRMREAGGRGGSGYAGAANLVVVGDSVDVPTLCEDYLEVWSEQCSASVSMYVVLSPSTPLLLLSHRSEAARLDRLLEAAGAADAVILVGLFSQLKPDERRAAAALLRLCAIASPEVTVLENLQSPQPLAVEWREEGSGLRQVSFSRAVSSDTWAAVQRPGAFDLFFDSTESGSKNGASPFVLVYVTGKAKEEGGTAMDVRVDAASSCVVLIEEEDEEEQAGPSSSGRVQLSDFTFHVWVTDAAKAEEAERAVRLLADQVLPATA